MDPIASFINYYGQDKATSISNFIETNDLLEEFNQIKNNNHKLFFFGIKYGIIEIVKFLYEELNIEYDHDILFGFDVSLDSNKLLSTTITSSLESGLSGNTKLTLTTWDKFSENRRQCINYLIEMKKYSKVRTYNKKFYYKFNK